MITFSLSAKTAPRRTKKNKTVDIFFAIPSKALRIFFGNMPISTGTVTIKNIFKAISISDIPSFARFVPSKDNEIPNIKGIVITLSILMTAVRDIESATSPLAKEVKIFEVAPPGAAASIITPIAISGDKGHIKTRINATIDNIIS